MKTYRLIFTLLTAWLSLAVQAQQTYPIYVQPSLTPPYSLTLADYVQSGSQRMVTTIAVNDLNVSNLPVKLHLRIEAMTGITVETTPNAATAPLYLSGGEVNILFGDDLAEYFNLNNLSFRGYSKEDYRRNGQLPEGLYRFTVELRHYTTGRLVSNQGTAIAWMAAGQPPLLKTPDDKSEQGQIPGMPLVFSWQPSAVGIPGVAVQYTFELWEMRVPGIDPYVVAASMPVFYSTTQMGTALTVHPAELMLEPGMTYAWRVTASDTYGQLSFAQGGRSLMRTFTYQCKCDQVNGLRAELQGSSSGVFSWNAGTDHTAFNIELINPTTGWTRKETVYNTRLNLPNLEAGSTYQLRVQAICKGNSQNPSDFSGWQTLKIPEKPKASEDCPDCGCRNTGSEPQVTNTTLKKDLKPGDIITSPSGQSRYIIKNLTQTGDGVYRGQFFFWLEIWKVKVLCDYWDLKVNTDNQVISMGFESVYDPQYLLDLDLAKDYWGQVKDAVKILIEEVNNFLAKYTGSESDKKQAAEYMTKVTEATQALLNDPDVSEEDKSALRAAYDKAQPAWENLKKGIPCPDGSQGEEPKNGPNPSNVNAADFSCHGAPCKELDEQIDRITKSFDPEEYLIEAYKHLSSIGETINEHKFVILYSTNCISRKELEKNVLILTNYNSELKAIVNNDKNNIKQAKAVSYLYRGRINIALSVETGNRFDRSFFFTDGLKVSEISEKEKN